MKAITNLYQLEKDLADRLDSIEMAKEIIEDHSVEIYHAWTNDDIARKALEMVEEEPKTIDIADIEKYRDEIVDFLIDSEDFNIEEVGDKFADAWDASEIGVNC
jgi:hypothetical protein